MGRYRIISADSHVVEPGDLWATRMDPKFGDDIPRLVSKEDADWWYFAGEQGNSMQGGLQPGLRFEHPEDLRYAGRWESVRKGGYDPEERVKDSDMDGVEGEVIYPTTGLFAFNVSNTELFEALCIAYNDWIAEFCSGHPHRLKGIGMIPLDNVDNGIKELERTRKMGLQGALISVYSPADRSYDSLEYEPFWAAAQDMEIPLSLHLGSNRPGPGKMENTNQSKVRPAFYVTSDYWVRVSIAHMIYSAVFERYPKLKVLSVEQDIAWAPYFIDQLDYTYTQRPHREQGWPWFKGGLLPSDYFRSNILLSFQEDPRGVKDRHVMGVDNLLWGSDYPHTETTFPRTREITDEIFADVPEDETAKIVGENATRVYNFN